MDQRRHIEQLLEAMGISRLYLGYDIAAEAVWRILQSGGSLVCLREQVYLPLAEKHHCPLTLLERNLRTVIRRAWIINAQLLQDISPYPLHAQPTVSEFLDILCTHILRSEPSPSRPLRHRGP